ncbi:MAG: CoA pyrophosphatase [bacterium]|nr:CoA pyrophosphatase [bacterium]
MGRLEEFARAFEGHAPALILDPARVRASVALVVTERADDLALLFIERASHPQDRWSGHIAFPGGRVDREDASPRTTAERETLEEVGLSRAGAQRIARLDDLAGFRESVLVSGFVYAVAQAPPLALNHEVEHAFWLGFGELEDPARHVTMAFDYRGTELVLPAIRVLDRDEPVLWGLSYRFLELVMARCGREIAPMPWDPHV